MLGFRRSIRLLAPVLLTGLLAVAPVKAAVPPRLPCDPLDPVHCLLPFPNDYFTRDAGPGDISGTGKMIDFQIAEMPRNVAGKPIDPTEWNRNDGFSPGSMVLTFVPGLDLRRTWGTHDDFAGDPRLDGLNDPRDHIADIGRYQAVDAPILIIDATTGERWPFWSELDTNEFTKPGEAALIMRPATNFLEGHRYLVALRNMRASDGTVLPAGPAFTAIRDGLFGLVPEALVERAGHISDVIGDIERAETQRGNSFNSLDLYLAWDFTIASAQNLAGRVLHMRDESLAALGDNIPGDGLATGVSPDVTITSVQDFNQATPPNHEDRLRHVFGKIKVPNYLDGDPYNPSATPPAVVGAQSLGGRRLVYGPDGLPMPNPAFPTIDVEFSCTLPRPLPAYAGGPAHPILYGHGLLGSTSEARGGSNARMRERNFMPCATNWLGFSNIDVGNAVLTLADPSNMPTMVDRSLQGFLNWIYLSRAIVHPDGLAAHDEFRGENDEPLFNLGELNYDGNSQGGIMGGALCALSVDLRRCVLGVVGMNYSTLLNRSVDWEDLYAYALYTTFPSKQEQQVVMALLQMLWDRAEANGYAQHMSSDPLPNTPSHQVLLHAAYGDFQVTNVSAEVEARTIGARVMDTSLSAPTADGAPRHWTASGYPYFGMQPFDRGTGGAILPWNQSALVYWDSGNLRPPNGNVPAEGAGGDPHEDPRRDPRGGDQKAYFFIYGSIIDVMNGGAYLTCRPDARSAIPRVQSEFHSSVGDWCP